MKNLFQASRVLLLDMASTLLFLAAYLLTGSIFLAVALGMALGIGQIAWELAKKQPVEALQWLSLVIILASGSATFFTNDPVFVMLKPTVIYVIVGIVMLKRGWMNRLGHRQQGRAVPGPIHGDEVDGRPPGAGDDGGYLNWTPTTS
ncbi:MAG: septation protein IspZ [Rhodospirillales bacterium]|nr:septation protein IspZ [Rhodospirillales bacterium]